MSIWLMDAMGWWLANGWKFILIAMVGAPLVIYGYLTINGRAKQ